MGGLGIRQQMVFIIRVNDVPIGNLAVDALAPLCLGLLDRTDLLGSISRIELIEPVAQRRNPMAYNELFALAFVAPYVASEKKIPPTTVQEMMRRSLYHIKWYFAKTDLNTDKGKAENKKSVVKYAKWYTPEKEAKYPTSFKVDFVGQPYECACYYRITRCPICIYTEKLGVSELMPLFCELDEVMITLQHGVLHRKQTLANGGEYCDYFITGNRE